MARVNYRNRVYGYRICELVPTKIKTGSILNRTVRNGWTLGRQIGLYHSFDAALEAFKECDLKNCTLFFDSFGRGIVTIVDRIKGNTSYLINTIVLNTKHGNISETSMVDPWSEVPCMIWNRFDDSLKDGSFKAISQVAEYSRTGNQHLVPVMRENDIQGTPCKEYRFTRSTDNEDDL